MSGRPALIFVGGSEPDPRVAAHLDRTAMVIAADSGWAHAVALGFTPDDLVGDMDSIEATDLAAARARTGAVHQFPAEKDATDADLAIAHALEQGCGSITVVSGVGERLDHLLAMTHSIAGIDAPLIAYIGAARIQFASSSRECTIAVRTGSLVSLIPLGGNATGVHTSGLKWNLSGDTLRALESRGVSNVATADVVTVATATGHIAVVQPDFLHTDQHRPETGKT